MLFLSAMSIDLLHAQNIGINANGGAPHASAILDVRSPNKGFLLPRISLTTDTDITTVSNPLLSLLVYNTNTGLPDGEGFYFWNGTKWSKLATRSNLANLAWNVAGNSGTNTSTDFIGTTDNTPLVFKTNNILSGKIEPGPNNVFFGQSAGLATTSATNNSFFGHGAGQNALAGSNNLFAGHNAGMLTTNGNENVFLGQDAGKNNTMGNNNVFAGEDAGVDNLVGDEAVYIGNKAGRNKLGSYNVAIGYDALANGYPSAQYNIAIGHKAGYNAGNSYILTAGSGIYIGIAAGYNATGGIAIGDSACKSCDPPYSSPNIAIGRYALLSSGNGEGNVALGANALVMNTTGDYNVALGNNALNVTTIGDYNTAIGYGAGPQPFVPSLVNTTCLGNGARVTTSNTMSFGNGDVANWAFGNNAVLVGAAFQVGDNSTNGNGAYLTEGGNWINTSDVNKKENFTSLNKSELLQKISSLTIQRWRYKGTKEYHIGPTAQEFYKLFNVGVDDKGISTVDPAGIALAAIQELISENSLLKQRLEKLEAIILKNRIAICNLM